MRDFFDSSSFMGAHPVIFAGDQRQILPITKQNTLASALANDIKSSSAFSQFRVFNLTAPKRNAGDPDYSASVDAVGCGTAPGPLPVDHRGYEHDVFVPAGVDILDGEDGEEQLRQFVHPRLESGAASTCRRRQLAAAAAL